PQCGGRSLAASNERADRVATPSSRLRSRQETSLHLDHTSPSFAATIHRADARREVVAGVCSKHLHTRGLWSNIFYRQTFPNHAGCRVIRNPDAAVSKNF